MTVERVAEIERRLTEALNPESLSLRDDSARHAGHEGAKGGGGHFHADIVAKVFEGQKLLERHRTVYAALGDMMQQEIHAFSMTVKTPDEVSGG